MLGRKITEPARSSHWLGLKASLSLRRFVVLYGKYSDDQPRDERGRWTDTGAGGHDVDVTGSVVNNARTGNPRIDATTDVLLESLEKAVEGAGPGWGPGYGIMIHSRFEALVRQENLPGVEIEKSWMEGKSVLYGSLGSLRTDIILRDGSPGAAPVEAIWDLKTGSATLTQSRVDDLRKAVGAGPNVPVIELHYTRGVRIKQVTLWARSFADV